jgi:hypothetical protein
LGLVLDEPTAKDKVEKVGDLQFVVDGELASGLAAYLPVEVDYDDRQWFGLRVKAHRAACC